MSVVDPSRLTENENYQDYKKSKFVEYYPRVFLGIFVALWIIFMVSVLLGFTEGFGSFVGGLIVIPSFIPALLLAQWSIKIRSAKWAIVVNYIFTAISLALIIFWFFY